MSEYDAFLNLLAAHPGAARDELRELASEHDRLNAAAVDDYLNNALARKEALEANDSY